MCLPFALAAYRATRHDATGYSPNFLVLGREVRHPVDLVYGTVGESPDSDYGRFADGLRERMSEAFGETRQTLGRHAERNKKYYDVSVRPNKFSVGEWVLYFNVRKYRGRQMKWRRQYEGPYLVTRLPSTLTVEIQKSAKSPPRVVHVDKLKKYVGATPRSWMTRTVYNNNCTLFIT